MSVIDGHFAEFDSVGELGASHGVHAGAMGHETHRPRALSTAKSKAVRL